MDTAVHLSAVVRVQLFVMPTAGSNRGARAATLQTITERESVAAERILSEVRVALGTKGWTISSAVCTGHPADQLLREIHDIDPDLMVLGAKGCAGTERFVLGSVARKVLDHAPCSVLLVRPWGALSRCQALSW
jgi:nucleotide-binding universal stress UspA family protein